MVTVSHSLEMTNRGDMTWEVPKPRLWPSVLSLCKDGEALKCGWSDEKGRHEMNSPRRLQIPRQTLGTWLLKLVTFAVSGDSKVRWSPAGRHVESCQPEMRRNMLFSSGVDYIHKDQLSTEDWFCPLNCHAWLTSARKTISFFGPYLLTK